MELSHPSCQFNCVVQVDDFDVATEYVKLQQTAHCGAVVLFSGLVRQQFDGCLEGLELEHYPGMTEQAMLKIAKQASHRFEINAITAIHRVGILLPHDQIVLVGVAAPHRKDAFAACEFMMDFLKSEVPIWKKSHYYQHGASQSVWVESKQSDVDAKDRWHDNASN
jgi:molybdopterin synthase catalytic subunit